MIVNKRVDGLFDNLSVRLLYPVKKEKGVCSRDTLLAHLQAMASENANASSGKHAFYVTDNNSVYNTAYLLGFESARTECRNVGHKVNLTETILVENAISDLVGKAVKTVKSLFTGLGTTVRDAVKKILPKTNRPLTDKEITKIKDTADKVITKYKNKVKTVVQDEITKAQNDGMVDAYQKSGIKSIMVKIETVKDHRRCKKCAELEGKVIPIEQARGLIPAGTHPNCRCHWKLPNEGAAPKAIRQEQKIQERTAIKLRERLDRKYKQKQVDLAKKVKSVAKAIHNEKCLCDVQVLNQAHADMTILPESALSCYCTISVPDAVVGSHHIIVKPVRCTQRKSKCKISFDAWRDKPQGMYDALPYELSTGIVVRLDYHNPKTQEQRWSVIHDMLPHSNHTDWQGMLIADVQKYRKTQTILLLPEDIDLYPYILAELVTNKSIKAVMVNPSKGYFEICGVRTALLDFDDLFERVQRLGMTISFG